MTNAVRGPAQRACFAVRVLAALVAAVALAAPLHAGAAVLYQYRALCELRCEELGLAPGDVVGGIIGFVDDAVANGVASSPDEIDAFDVRFGTLHFDRASLGTAIATFAGYAREVPAFLFITNASADSPGYAFGQGFWIAGVDLDHAAIGGPGTLTRIAPEPPLLLLLLTALGATRARRRRTTLRLP